MISRAEEDRLAAWLDGALPSDEARRFEADMAANPELRTLADEWRKNDQLIAAAFAPIAARPVEDRLLEQMGLAGADAVPIAGEGTQRPAANDNPPVRWRRYLAVGGTLAAACAALVALVGLPGGPSDPLSQALDRTPSLASATLPDGRVIEPTLTVRAADGRWCREFREKGNVALACREPDGQWRAQGGGRGQGPDSADAIGLAAGADTSALDLAYRRLGASDPVDRAQEARLIGNGWR